MLKRLQDTSFSGEVAMDNITIDTVGVIHSPYSKPRSMPIQGVFKPEMEALVEFKMRFGNDSKDVVGQ